MRVKKLSLSNFEFSFSKPKQGLFKMGDNDFKIVTEYGKERKVNFNELLVYLFSEGMNNSLEVSDNIRRYDAVFDMSIHEINDLLNQLVEEQFLKFEPRKKELHKHYSYNPVKILNYARSVSAAKKTNEFISLGKLELAVTHKCPFNCTYCSKKEYNPSEQLSLEEKKKVIYEAYELGAQTIALTGGEPLHDEVAEETFELIGYASDLGYKRKVLLTSGYHIDKYFQSIIDSHLDEVQVSYNMSCKFYEDRVRNQYIEKNIKQISGLMDYGIRLGICSVLTNESIGFIDEIIKFCLENKLYSVYFYPVMPVGDAKNIWNEIKLDVSDLKNALALIKERREELKQRLYISAPQSFLQDEKPLQICEGGMYMLYVTESGDTAACACSAASGFNVRDYSLSWIWKESRYFDGYRIVKSVNSLCQACDDYSLCINSCVCRESLAVRNFKFSSGKCALITGNLKINEIGSVME
ncbi:radical SAM protein [Paenibacillus macerans]|uniref:radical SAM protein n=1 Tax=Paenibacillus macerans TaxID=44252 RepID=UPI002E20D465|nr:radical SAM protein [Paenibacillus macerans]